MHAEPRTRGQTGKAEHRGMRSCGLTLACLWMVGCGGNGSTPPPPGADADVRPAGGAAYPVPVYVQQVPVYAPSAQAAPSWGGIPNTAMQPGQPYASAQGQYPYPGQNPAQYPVQQQYAPPAPVQQSGGYNPWAIQAQRQHHANGWAASQPWGGAVHQQQQPEPGAYQYRPLEGDARQMPPVAAPYDQPFGSSQRPLPATPGYGAYAGGYAGAWPGSGGPWGGTWPGGHYGGGYPGYGGGWPGGWGGMPYGGGFPGMWPGMW